MHCAPKQDINLQPYIADVFLLLFHIIENLQPAISTLTDSRDRVIGHKCKLIIQALQRPRKVYNIGGSGL